MTDAERALRLYEATEKRLCPSGLEFAEYVPMLNARIRQLTERETELRRAGGTLALLVAPHARGEWDRIVRAHVGADERAVTPAAPDRSQPDA